MVRVYLLQILVNFILPLQVVLWFSMMFCIFPLLQPTWLVCNDFAQTMTPLLNFIIFILWWGIRKRDLLFFKEKIEKSLYKLSATIRDVAHPLAFYSTSSTSHIGSLRLWHNRLGHPSFDVVHKIISFCKIPLKHDNNNSACECFQMAKSHRLPFERSTSRTIKPFGFIHVDLWGATPIVYVNGARYFLLLVYEALLMFQCFQAMVERQFDPKVQCV